MRRLLTLAAALVGVLAIVAGAFAVYVELDGIPHYPTQPVPLVVVSTPERVARGHQLSSMLCAGCHRDPKTGRLSGADMRLDDQFGNIHSYNITRHPERGIGRWTDGELAYLLRTGVARDGRYTPPWMAKLPHLSDEDLASIIAYLRSDAPELEPTDVPSIPSKPNFFSKFLAHVAFKPYPYPTAPVEAPPTTDEVAYGRYLTWNLDCWTCHSPDFSTIDPLHPDRTPGYLSGGNTLMEGDGNPVRTPNLTPDPETGLGRWTEAQFVRVVREAIRPDGTPNRMNALPQLTDAEVHAIWAYLRTVPPIRHEVPRTPFPAAPPDASRGQALYFKYGCAGCHTASGSGVCDLTPNRAHYATDDALVAFIREPQSVVPGSNMPTWRDVIAESDMRELVSHVRTLARP